MKKQLIVLSLVLLSCLVSFSQITIEDCYLKAQANYPLIKQYGLIEKSKQYNLSNVSKGYLPQIMFSAKASYQSEVTQLPFESSQFDFLGISIPTLSKDQYSATIDVNQTIWDGGVIKSRREVVKSSSEVEIQNLEVSIYSINERINQLYFGVLLAEAQIRQNLILQEDLKKVHDQMESYVQNGIANQADLDAVKVDQLKSEQNLIQYVSTQKAYIEMLSKLTGEKFDIDTEFVKPQMLRPSTDMINRPELSLYSSQIKSYETQNKEINSNLTPKIGFYITGGYGQPGLNMLKNGFSPYYTFGAKLTWNIGNFYTNKNSKNLLKTNINSIETQRETFLFNVGLDITQMQNELDKYFEQLKSDDEIIKLRTSIRQSSEIKMANGTISGTDLIRDINSEQMAIQDKIIHEAQLLLTIYNLKYTTNN